MTAGELFKQGRLDAAIAAATDAVKARPADTAGRFLLAELLAFKGEIERADTQLDTIGKQEPKAQMVVSLFRQLLRAEQARQQFHAEGRVPEVLFEPGETLKLRLEASVALRAGDASTAMKLLDEAEEKRPRVAGRVDGQPFSDMRDLDDLLGDLLEVLTPTGKFFLVPSSSVSSMEFRKPASPRDLLFRPVSMTVRDGPEGEVYLPALYAGSAASDDDALRLGRATDWTGGEGQPVRGVGLRMFVFDEDDRDVLSLNTIEIDQA